MTANTSSIQSSGSSPSGFAKPTFAASAGALLRTPIKKAKAAPSHEEIVLRAYEIWLAKEKESGHDQEHWFQAERELSGR
jgi:hypothetical protein